MSRPAWVEIDLAALQANYTAAKKAHGGRVFAVLKANAYGHGALACAQALATASPPADAFAVAFVEEALPLRAAGITQPILVLEGAFAADDVQLAAQHQLWLVTHQAQQLQLIEQHAGAALHIWLKVDSGMHRVGFAPHDIAAVHARLAALPQVEKVSFLTHLARADELDTPAPTEAQLHAFHTATANLAGWRSISNSAAILAWPQAHQDWGRAGIMLYGAAPCASSTALQPVMALKSRIFAQRWLEVGDSLGYGAAFTATQRTRVGLADTAGKRCEELSKGMQQKVQYIAAVIQKPELLILDEPFSGLDPVNMRLLKELILAQHASGTTVLFSTHVMFQAEQLCEHIVMIHDGQKVLDDPLAAIRARHTARALDFEPLDGGAEVEATLLQIPGIEQVVRNDGRWRLHFGPSVDVPAMVQAVAARVPPAKLELVRPNLEDVFIKIATARQNQATEVAA